MVKEYLLFLGEESMKVNTRMGNKIVKEQKLTLVEVRMIGEWKDGVRNGQETYTQYGSL